MTKKELEQFIVTSFHNQVFDRMEVLTFEEEIIGLNGGNLEIKCYICNPFDNDGSYYAYFYFSPFGYLAEETNRREYPRDAKEKHSKEVDALEEGFKEYMAYWEAQEPTTTTAE